MTEEEMEARRASEDEEKDRDLVEAQIFWIQLDADEYFQTFEEVTQ